MNYCIVNWSTCNFQQFSAILGEIFASFIPAVGSMMSSLLEIMVPRHAFSEKHKNMLKYRKIFELLRYKLEYLQFSAILGEMFASFTPAVGSMTTFLLNIMVTRHFLSEKHKNMLKY